MSEQDHSLHSLRSVLSLVAGTLPELPYKAWHFGDSVAFEAMIAASAALNSPEYEAFARGFVRGWAARGHEFTPMDCTAAGHAMVLLAEHLGDANILSAAGALADYLTSRRTTRGVYNTWEQSPLRQPYGPVGLDAEGLDLLTAPGPGVFIDCLHFDPPFFAALGRATGDQHWLDEAVAQALGYVELLQDPSGLFHHFFLARTGQKYMLGWGRGQGWALLGLLTVIECTPDHPAVRRLRAAASSLTAAMLRHQRPDGHWDAVVGAPESGDESSTAAFMVTALRRASRLDLVPSAQLEPAIGRALNATSAAIDDRGVLTGVSAEVWACTLDQHYWHVPRNFLVPWGQGPAALALAQATADMTLSAGDSDTDISTEVVIE